MKDILLCADGSSYGENAHKYTAWIAKRLGAMVNVLSVTDNREPSKSSQDNWNNGIGLGASDELWQKLVELEHERAKLNHLRAKIILDQTREMLEQEGITSVNCFHKTGFLAECIKEMENKTDLIVLGKRGENAEYDSLYLGANLERIVRCITKPCFVFPRDYINIDRVLIAYDGSATGDKILQFLIDFPFMKDLELHLLMVSKTAKNHEGMNKLEKSSRLLKNAGFNVQLLLLSGEAESIISSYIDLNQINLLIMGAYGHSRIRNLIIGSTTIQLLRNTSIPALLLR